MRHLDLFSGIGGFALAAQWAGMQTIGFSEIDDFACKVLAKNFPKVPNLGNIKEIEGNECGSIDIITGGYPCQPFSGAGKQRGKHDNRHLWPEMFRIIKTARPAWVLCENVVGHIKLGLDEVLDDLEGEGYAARPIVIPACATDKIHRRDRVWILANSDSYGGDELFQKSFLEKHNAQSEIKPRGRRFCSTRGYSTRETASRILRRDDGVHNGAHRNKALGNAIVPQVAFEILRCVAEIEKQSNR